MKILVAVIIGFAPCAAIAQQDPLYAQYMFNPLLINPAYAGLNANLTGMVGYRTQWVGLEGQPRTFYANGAASIMDNRAGAGISVICDKLGNLSSVETSVSFAYKLDLDENIFSFGMQAGFQSFRTDYAGLTIFDNDDIAFVGNERGSRLNIGAGAIFKSERFFVGLSVPRMLPSTFENGGQEFQLYNQHFYLAAGYMFLLNEHVRFKPSTLLRGVKGAPLSVDVSLNVNINALHTAGLFTRGFNTYGVLLQTLVRERIRFGYAFELPANKTAAVNFSTHEISLGVQIPAFSFHETTLNNF